MSETHRAPLLAHPEAIELEPGHIAEGSVFVAEMDGALAGLCLIVRHKEEGWEIDGLFVEPDCWRRGIGAALLAEAESAAASAGVRRRIVIADSEAQGFYEAAGYVRTGTVETRFDDAPMLGRPLQPCPVPGSSDDPRNR